MWLAELQFRLVSDTSYSQAEQQIRQYLEALIFQGQLIGREFPTYFASDHFCSRVILPAEDALITQHHSPRGQQALAALPEAGLAYPKLKLLGQDLMSSHTDPCQPAEGYILFTNFAEQVSPLRCSAHFAPVPLYRLGADSTADYEDFIRWQLQYQALDEIQMQQQRVLPKSAENALQQLHSKLNQQGRQLARRVEKLSGKSCYYYLYSGSSQDCSQEASKQCPGCASDWRLDGSWHGLFQFRCDHCRLVSNIAWDCQ
ncbi:DUF2310 family Zn-ribbon-containing protein [Alkalimonas amylolytica]|uniref:Predicted nucleic acid-binding protein, contains Zn-ribbon domain n=1 Tax=Alkalimonas amylolytica TaxID=152573 RepID=A0A1H4FAD8_ALKAM|nr:DUF2310 family Zn-ribbon-containing protein [Alkalimonas amylolytica]SEA94245.1 Predicted nucleic acid-binding protein, contains Zn-ribbon domain [Alkalimonas amylolytica]